MLTLGFNLGVTHFGKRLKDGGCCIINDGEILVSIAEERLTREKATGGYKNALDYCLITTGYSLNDIDKIVFSSCLEYPSDIDTPPLNLSNYGKLELLPSHHLSHAYSAYFPSQFGSAIIIVLDAGGTLLEKPKNNIWWHHAREQQSYYIAREECIDLINRDFAKPHEAGIGEIYRAFTHFLGWRSYVYSGKTMALAAYGDPERYKNIRLFELDSQGHMKSVIVNNPPTPNNMVLEFAKRVGIDFGKPRKPSQPIEQIHKDIAWFVQSEVERILVDKVNFLVKKTGINNLCVAGGVGLNCAANSRILEQTAIKNIFIQPASGDQGQCLGNALYGYHKLLGGKKRYPMANVYLGRTYNFSRQNILASIDKIQGDIKVWHSDNICNTAAKLIARGDVVAWFQGKSEFGPRALGNRSILCDPRLPSMRLRLNGHVKGRETILPYAASILEEFTSDYFALDRESPFMLLAPKIIKQKAEIVPAIVHKDGSVRVQTVSKKDNPVFYELICEFKNLTHIPLILNTSLNGKGEPICETPQDAFSCFIRNNIDHLIIGESVFSKKESSQGKTQEEI